MRSALRELNGSDLLKSGMTAVFAAVVVTLYGVVTGSDFSLFTTDWIVVGTKILDVSVAAFIGDVFRRYISDENGDIPTPLGKIKLGSKN